MSEYLQANFNFAFVNLRGMQKLTLISNLALVLALVTSLRATSSLAQDDITTTDSGRGTHWTTIIDKLQSEGVGKVGAFDVGNFRKQASGIQWNSLTGAPASVLSGSRQSAYYYWQQKKVYISDQLPQEAMSSLPQLELHEALGATGYNDRNYALSTALSTLSTLPDASQRSSLGNAYGHSLFQSPSAMSIGGSGVSGGGDLATLYIKDQILKLIMGDGQFAPTTAFLVDYPSINFEPLQSSMLNEVYVQYSYKIKAARHESVDVYIPMKRWKAGAASRAALIREAAQKITEIYPAYHNVPLHTFRPSECTSDSQTVSYPESNDPAVLSIQDMRGALQLGCKKFFPGETDVATVAPALSNDEAPKTSGNFYFACEFAYGAATQDYQIKVAAGTHALSSVSWGIVEDDYLSGTIAVLQNGNIQAIMLDYIPPGGTHSPMKPEKPKSPTSASTSMVINGQELTFTCQREK